MVDEGRRTGDVDAITFPKALKVELLAWPGFREGWIPYCSAAGFVVQWQKLVAGLQRGFGNLNVACLSCMVLNRPFSAKLRKEPA